MTPKPFQPTRLSRPKRENGHFAFWFYNTTYSENVYLIWPVNEEQRRAFFTRQFQFSDFSAERPSVWDGRCSEVLNPDGSCSCQVISLREWKGRPKDYGVLAHEALHLVEQITTRRGVRFDNSPEAANEAHTYLMQDIMTTCVQALQMGSRARQTNK